MSLKSFTRFQASIIAFGMAKKLFHVFSAKDYKKVGNGNTGANTGGMGTVAQVQEFTAEHFADF